MTTTVIKKKLSHVNEDKQRKEIEKRAKRICKEIEELNTENGLKYLRNTMDKSLLDALCAAPEPANVSRMEISDEMKIRLTDYDIDIHMNRTLCKVFYILFLRHPEGIRLKEIADYQDELVFIYKSVSNRTDLGKMRKSVEAAIDIENRSLLFQYISRANKAFREKLSPRLAEQYVISSDRTNTSVIRLDRGLVTMPDFLCDDGICQR